MKKYKWDNPYEWLETKSEKWTREQLRSALLALAIKHDSDTIQDEYQSEMDADGYFDEL